MNCIYAGAFLSFSRNIAESTLFFGELFNLRGNVIATSTENKYLVALRENGEILYSEAEIVTQVKCKNRKNIFIRFAIIKKSLKNSIQKKRDII